MNMSDVFVVMTWQAEDYLGLSLPVCRLALPYYVGLLEEI